MIRRAPKNNGKGLEATVIASQGGVIRIEQFGAQLKFLPGGKRTAIKGPVDFAGTIIRNGRSILFDAKSCNEVASLNASRSHLAPHQRFSLIRQGEVGAVAGILAEATHADLGEFYWLPWWMLTDSRISYPWHELIELGTSKRTIDFAHLIALHDNAIPERLKLRGGLCG